MHIRKKLFSSLVIIFLLFIVSDFQQAFLAPKKVLGTHDGPVAMSFSGSEYDEANFDRPNVAPTILALVVFGVSMTYLVSPVFKHRRHKKLHAR